MFLLQDRGPACNATAQVTRHKTKVLLESHRVQEAVRGAERQTLPGTHLEPCGLSYNQPESLRLGEVFLTHVSLTVTPPNSYHLADMSCDTLSKEEESLGLPGKTKFCNCLLKLHKIIA